MTAQTPVFGGLLPAQITTLDSPIERNSIYLKQGHAYVPGWEILRRLNRIFGFDGWDRETLESKCIWQSASRGAATCAYTAKVRIRVRAHGTTVTRDGSGTGQAR